MKKSAKIFSTVLAAAFVCGVIAGCTESGTDDSSAPDSSTASAEVQSYTVTYDPAGGTLTGETQQKVNEGESVTLPEVGLENYTFIGWYDGDTSVGMNGESYTPAGNVTLTAHWEENLPDYASINMERAVEYGKLIREEYWNSDTKLSQLTPQGGSPYLWPYTEQVSMVNGILLAMEKDDPDYAYFSEYLVELIEGLRHYRVGSVSVGSGEFWENPDHFLAKFGENDGTFNSYAIYNSGRNDGAIDSVNAGMGGIFFDDNIWVAKEFYYAYVNLGDVKYLNEAINIVNWIIGEGYESAEGLNGIYWKWGAKFLFENKAGGGLDDNNHASLNACSSAPTSMMLVKLYNAMGDESLNGKFDSMRADYLLKAQNIYEFCYSVLRNPSSGCIRDKIFLAEGFEDMGNSDGRIQLMDAQELPYNTGTFMTAGAELYNCAKASGSELLASVYLDRNKDVAESADRQFANRMVVEGQYSYNSNSWFTSFLLEGFIDLSEAIPECAEYIEHMRSALDYGWNNNRADDGLVCPAWIEGWSAFNDSNPNSEGNPRQILLQSANAHCYAMLARYYAHS